MKLAELKTKAKEMGIKPGKMGKTELIREIQLTEGNSPCFGTAGGSCDQLECSWRDDCLG